MIDKQTKTLLTVCGLLLVGLILSLGLTLRNQLTNSNPGQSSTPATTAQPSKTSLIPVTPPQPASTPTPRVKKDPLQMAFYVQAPFGNWDALHEEACEEAATLMVHYWTKGEKPSLQDYDQQLKDLVSWQSQNGYGVSLDAEELKTVAEQYIHLSLRVITVKTKDDITSELDKGNPIIFPAAGRLLDNPFFSGDGPVYHMLVILSYKGDQFTTNDPGTKRGRLYQYSWATLNNALGNWDGSRVDRGDRRVLVMDQEA